MRMAFKRFIHEQVRGSVFAALLVLVLSLWLTGKSFAHHGPYDPETVITPDHLETALEAVIISRSARPYLEILPSLSEQLKRQLSNDNPQFQEDIIKAVDEAAHQLQKQQKDLDELIAREWARAFNLQELRDISAFFSSPAGAKLAAHNTELIALGLAAARNWSQEIQAELLLRVTKTLEAQGKKL